MKLFWTIQALAAVLAVSILSGWSFHVGFDYNGKTGVDNQTVSPEFRTNKQVKY
jgi:hypothetical protein